MADKTKAADALGILNETVTIQKELEKIVMANDPGKATEIATIMKRAPTCAGTGTGTGTGIT